jgi:hypothetical protein
MKVNVNGVDVGVLDSHGYCSFETNDSKLTFSYDGDLNAWGVTGAIVNLVLIPPAGIVNIALTTGDRYERTRPLTLDVEDASDWSYLGSVDG